MQYLLFFGRRTNPVGKLYLFGKMLFLAARIYGSINYFSFLACSSVYDTIFCSQNVSVKAREGLFIGVNEYFWRRVLLVCLYGNLCIINKT